MEWVYVVGLALVLLASVLLIRQLDRPAGDWARTVRSRLLMGIPWGTLVAVGFVLFVYLVIQDGRANVYDPVRIPFQAWSYRYPTGMFFAGFAHADYGHLIGNVTATLVLGTLAEAAFSHYPQRKGAVSFGRRLTNPYVRAFVIFPLGVIIVGLLTGIFALGPVIGFSGVVFAFAGLALVRYPLTTVIGILVIQAIRRLFNAIRRPTISAGIDAPAPAAPWWAEIAVQGHAIGLFIGVAIGLYLLHRRGIRPPAWRIWTAVFLFGIAQGLWAVYWFEGTDRFLLYQGIGVILVVILAMLITATLTSSSRELAFEFSHRQVAIGIFLICLVLLAVPAVMVNLVTTESGVAGEHAGIDVEDYRVIYGEEVTNRMVAVVDIDIAGLGEVRTSGVIVVSEQRDIWMTAISKQRLQSRGQGTVTLGGIGWREHVTAEWDAWKPVGNDSVYQVWLEGPDERVHAFAADAQRAEPIIANHTFDIFIDDAQFNVGVERDGDHVGTAAIPAHNETATIGEIDLRQEDGDLYAEHDGTVVRIASRD